MLLILIHKRYIELNNYLEILMFSKQIFIHQIVRYYNSCFNVPTLIFFLIFFTLNCLQIAAIYLIEFRLTNQSYLTTVCINQKFSLGFFYVYTFFFVLFLCDRLKWWTLLMSLICIWKSCTFLRFSSKLFNCFLIWYIYTRRSTGFFREFFSKSK